LRDKRFFEPMLRKFQAGEILPADSTQFQIDTMSKTIYGFDVYTNTNALLAKLKDKDSDIQRAAIREVGERKLVDAVETLISLLADSAYQDEIVSSLIKIGDKSAAKALVKYLGSVHNVNDFFIKFGSADVFDALLERFRTGDERAKDAVTQVLAKIGDKPVLDELYTEWQKSPNPSTVIILLIFALAEFQDERVIETLAARLYIRGTQDNVDGAAVMSAKSLAENYSSGKVTKILRDRLIAIPADEGDLYKLIYTITQALALRGGEGFEALLELIKSPNLSVKSAAISDLPIDENKELALSVLLPLLQDKTRVPNANWRICDQAAMQLRNYGIDEALTINEEWKILNETGFFIRRD
jgi:HEAT repeat protein